MQTEKITQPFIKNFPGDLTGNPHQRQTPGFLFTLVKPSEAKKPEKLIFNAELAEAIGLGTFDSDNDLDFLVGNNLPANIISYATAYAGHQFGQWAGQLGDGRAIYAGEILNDKAFPTEIQWKGSGATPYSRHADGRAVLRSSLREYLMSEAMHALGVPTTRALSLALTGDTVARDMMYDGNLAYEKGAVVIRTAESFLRFGHFELLAARDEIQNLQDLADFTIQKYFPEIISDGVQKYLDWFENVAEKTAEMIVHWYRVGFTHGVMNTDNMSVLGLTIDYGPFSMIDEYDLNFTPNTTDLPGRRYAFGKQANIAHWNIVKFANALFPLVKDEKALEKIVHNYATVFWDKYDAMMAKKFGFGEVLPGDKNFFTEWQTMMETLKVDFTLFFQRLENFNAEINPRKIFDGVFYKQLNEEEWAVLEDFLAHYALRLEQNKISREESLELMQASNPKFILRNYLLFECILEVEYGKTALLTKLLTALKDPYSEIFPEFSVKRPPQYEGQIGCSMLSCSS